MEHIEYLRILAEEIHSVVVATVDEKGLPVTRVIDMMLYDEEGVYFLTAKGKAFYRQLESKPISRASFSIGGEQIVRSGYYIGEKCTSCGSCLAKCPQGCIAEGEPFEIGQANCLHCGNCFEVCPEDAVNKF